MKKVRMLLSGNLGYVGNNIQCSFYRFASLVPNPSTQPDNRSDGTYMTGGQFTNCSLYDRSNYVSWGINTSRIANAWKVYGTKISLNYSSYNDVFSISHT